MKLCCQLSILIHKILQISKPQKGAKNDKRIFDDGLLQELSKNEVMICYGALYPLTPF
jgi:hypothetical protein